MIARSPTSGTRRSRSTSAAATASRVDDPVINGDGLVGHVTAVTGGTAQVTLITDHASAVTAKVVGKRREGVVQPVVGDPGSSTST